MRFCKNLTDFVKTSDKEVTSIIKKRFNNLLNFYELEDLKSEIYLTFLKRRYIEKYRPFNIRVTDNTWAISATPAHFSTYVCKALFNTLYLCYNKLDFENSLIPLDAFSEDTYMSKNENFSIKKLFLNKNIYKVDFDSNLFIDKLLKYLQDTHNRGSVLGKDKPATFILRILNMYGTKGCSYFVLQKRFNKKFQESNLELYLTEMRVSGEISCKDSKYYIGKPDRRSLYKLCKYYVEGLTDKEISQKFNMTIAGVGVLKKNLKQEIIQFTNKGENTHVSSESNY